jgi:hypothetical protein
MLRKWTILAAPTVAIAGLFFILSGCNQSQDSTSVAPSGKKQPVSVSESKTPEPGKKDEVHGHKAGAHGGIIVELGRENYHVEAVFEKGGLLKLFTLGKDEARIIDVESQTLKAYVKDDMGTEAVEVDIQPVPRQGDKAGRTSQFVGKLPAELAGKSLTVTIPVIAIDGERFRIGFSSIPPKHESATTMPTGASLDEERELYLKPGGLYTLDDIKANGNVTASQKFKGVLASHDLKPKVGEKICPITLTKANPKFTWIVGGKAYEFCCPPCVDEFVATAKSNPELIRAPEEFVKKK